MKATLFRIFSLSFMLYSSLLWIRKIWILSRRRRSIRLTHSVLIIAGALLSSCTSVYNCSTTSFLRSKKHRYYWQDVSGSKQYRVCSTNSKLSNVHGRTLLNDGVRGGTDRRAWLRLGLRTCWKAGFLSRRFWRWPLRTRRRGRWSRNWLNFLPNIPMCLRCTRTAKNAEGNRGNDTGEKTLIESFERHSYDSTYRFYCALFCMHSKV